MNSLKGQVAIITGGAGGLGSALAVHLSRLEVRVAIFDLNDAKTPSPAAPGAGEVIYVRADVSDQDACEVAVKQVLGRWGQIDILVNAVGITGMTGIKSYEVDVKDFDRVMKVNVRSCFLTTKFVVPLMLQRKYGRVLHIASIAGKEGNAGMIAYSASKAAVIGLTKTQGKEYAGSGVTVNAIAPAVIITELHDKMPQAQIDYMTSKTPMSRCGTLQEFADMATYIVSPECSFTTGFTFDLSGGRATY